MLNREEAKNNIFNCLPPEQTMTNYSIEFAIDEIFDSMGECKDCRYRDKDYYKSGIWCELHSFRQSEDWFCKDFKNDTLMEKGYKSCKHKYCDGVVYLYKEKQYYIDDMVQSEDFLMPNGDKVNSRTPMVCNECGDRITLSISDDGLTITALSINDL